MQVAVIGLGEVGLKFASLIATSGLKVLGVDTDPSRARLALHGLVEFGYEFTIPGLVVSGSPKPSDVYVICVDSPVDPKTRTADLHNLKAAVSSVGHVLRAGELVIVRSTVPVGTTRGLVEPLLVAASGLTPTEFYLAFAPERATTGGTLHESRLIRHLVGGRDGASASHAMALMEHGGMNCLEMESLEAAELGKLASNAVRDVSQAVANQIGQIAEMHDVDIRRFVDAVNLDYPRDHLKHASPGVGGSCLTKDSYILAQALAPSPPEDTLFGRARIVNDAAQDLTIASIRRHFSARISSETNILICGAAFKGHPPTADTRNSVGLRVASELRELGFSVRICDPVVTDEDLRALGFAPLLLPIEHTFDGVLLYSNHRRFANQTNVRPLWESLAPQGYVYDPHLQFDAFLASAPTGVLYRTMSTERMLS